MIFKETNASRRGFLKGALVAAASAPTTMLAGYTPFKQDSLQVWSCGGLSEAFLEINAKYEGHYNIGPDKNIIKNITSIINIVPKSF